MNSDYPDNLVFLCHANEDKPRIRAINQILTEEGFKTWFDEKDLQPGEVWEDHIENVIGRSRFFIAFLSQNLVSKGGYVQKELRLALGEMEKKAPGTIYLIPVLFGDVDIPRIKVGTINLAQLHALRVNNRLDLNQLTQHLKKIEGVTEKLQANTQPSGLDNVKLAIGQGKIEKALDGLKECVVSGFMEYENEVILLRMRYTDLQSRRRKGIISNDQLLQEMNRVTYSALDLVNTLKFTL